MSIILLILLICLTLTVICVLLFIRNIIVYKFTGKALAFIFSQDNWEELINQYSPNARYDKNMLSKHKWTYKSMFRELWEIENNAKSKN